MANYKNILKQNELEIIKYISIREEKRRTLQSIYQYVIKHATLNNGQFIISNKDFHKMYSRYHTKMKADTFRKYLDLLTKFGLVIKNKFKNVNMFSVNRNIKFNPNIFFADKKPTFVPTFVPTQNSSQTVDMTKLEGNQNLPNTKYKLNNTITIIDSTVSETVVDNEIKKSLAYEKAIEKNNKDLVEPSELIELAISKLKEQGRRSKKIIARLKTKLENRTNVVRKNVDKYLNAVIADAIAFYETGREKMALLIATKKAKYNSAYNLKKNKSMVATANFTQRKYDYDKLEAQLLGWDTSDDDDYEIGAIESTVAPTTANFTQRQYDYDKLEAQLLGWDTSDDDCEIDVAEPTNMPITTNFTQRQYDCDKLELQLLGWADSDSDDE